LHLTKTRPILAISEKSLIFALFTRKDDFLLHGKPDILQFPTGASLARPPSFPTGQLTFGRLAAGDYGHDIGNALFSSSVRIVFPAWRFLSPAAQGQTYGIILSLPFFHTTLALPNSRALRMRTKYTYFDRSDLRHWFAVPLGVVI
jgi:hypothetical protein